MIINSSRAAFHYLRTLLTAEVEELWLTALRADRAVIRSECLFRGTVDSCMAHPRDIFRFACIQNASAIIMAHNHPSQNPLPSQQDQKLTRQMMKISRMIEIPLLDHLIIVDDGYWSFADQRCYYFDDDGAD